MEKARLTFNKGMMPDLDVSIRPQGAYEEAINFTSTTANGNTNGALTTAKGNLYAGTLPSGYSIVGSAIVGEEVVVFAVSTSGNSAIYKLVTTDDHTTVTTSLVYNDIQSTIKLGFDTDYPIDAIGRYENENSQKVYWAQENQPLRVLNLALTYPNTMSASVFDVVPNYNMGNIAVSFIGEGGSIPAGKVQYCYKLLKKYGAESTFSYLTIPINITTASLSDPDGVTGDDKGTITGKSITLEFTNLPTTGWDILRVYRIHYDNNLVPTIGLISETPITNVVIDSGIVLEELTLEEFNSIGGRNFKAKTIESKDNMLFAANLTEDQPELTIDCRAYRFASGLEESPGFLSYLYNKDGTYYRVTAGGDWSLRSSTGTLLGPSGTNWEIPKEADCINRYNDEFLNDVDQDSTVSGSTGDKYPFRTNINTLDFGGTGKYISYTISHASGKNPATTNTLYTDYTIIYRNELGGSNRYSHRPGETYRYGVVFFDLKGKPYPVKWIGDIRIPRTSLRTYRFFGTQEEQCWSTPVDITFHLNSLPAEDAEKISGMMYVRVKKEQADRNILASGVTWSTEKLGNDWWHMSEPAALSTYSDTDRDFIHPFYSAELFYNGGVGIDGTSGYRAVITNIFGFERWARTIGQGAPIVKDGGGPNRFLTPTLTYDTIGGTGGMVVGQAFKVQDIAKLTTTEKNGSSISLARNSNTSVSFINRVRSDSAGHEMYGPSMVAFTTNTRLKKGYAINTPATQTWNYNGNSTTISRVIYGLDIYKNNANSIFGGNTYFARTNNTYTQASSFITKAYINNSNTKVTGDCVTSVFEALTSIHDPNFNDNDEGDSSYSLGTGVDRRQVVTFIPTTSYVDCSMSNFKPSRVIQEPLYATPANATSSDKIGLQETTAKGISLYGDRYPVTIPDLANYNNAYSTLPGYPTYATDSSIVSTIENLPYTVVVSEPKTNGELIDNWTSFKYANVLEVDTAGGEINALKRVDNKLFFWQDKAFGVISNNERALLSESNVGQLSLGTGGILERFDYISNNIGCESKQQLATSENEIYWLFNKLKRIYSYGAELKDLGLINGVTSYINNDYSVNPLVYYDQIEDEVHFKLGNKTLIYDSILNIFVSVLSYVPTNFIKLPNYNFLSSSNGTKLYVHNKETNIPGQYFDSVSAPSLTVVENQTFDKVKTYDTLNWSSNYTTSYIPGISQQNKTFNLLTVSNDYQYSGVVSIIPARREREFTYALPRDIVNKSEATNPDIYNIANQDANQLFKRRFRDRYLKLNFKITSPFIAGDKYTVHYLDVNYRPSIR